MAENPQHPVGGLLARAVVVVAQHQLVGVPGQHPGVVLGEGGAHGGHHVVKARLMEGDHVDIPLHQHQVGPLGGPGEVEGVDQPALFKDQGVWAVEVLGPLLPGENPAGKAHHIPPHVDDGEHKPGAELVVHSAVLPGHRQPGLHQLGLGEALGGEVTGEGVPLPRGGPQAEAGGRPGENPALGQVVPHRPALRGLEAVVVKPGGQLIGLQGPGPAAALPLALPGVRDLHPRPLGQQPHRVGEGQVFNGHHKGDHPAPLAAAKAVVDLLVRADGEGGGPLVVKGAKAPQVAPLLGQVDVGGDHLGDLAPGHQFIDKLLRNGHGPPPLPARACLNIGDMPSGEGFCAAGKQFDRGNPGGFQGKIAPSSGQKARRLGVLTMFKQALF